MEYLLRVKESDLIYLAGLKQLNPGTVENAAPIIEFINRIDAQIDAQQKANKAGQTPGNSG